MAKAQSTSTPQNPAPKKLVTREGLRKSAGDVVGFHDPETQGHIYGIPRGAKASDSQLDSRKPSLFVIFELLEDCEVTEGSGDDSAILQAKTGDMVGVWLKGGMRNMRNMCNLKVLMQHTGEKKLKGKPAAFNAMKTYQFDVGPGTGTLIPIIEDNRKDSRDEPTMLDVGQSQRKPGEDAEETDPGF